ncbi:hypothetical protein FQN57_006703 [Myotisia sp. PD_48]|nr:hypothetical protein FQN57_006703 [Myotisia sp. PD_48]
MGFYTFRWPHEAQHVIVTGNFDGWAKNIKLDKAKGREGFEKEVQIPDGHGDKVLYKYIVDGTWSTDPTAPQETDQNNYVNNVLLATKIRSSPNNPPSVKPAVAGTGIMSGVAPDSTTAQLAGNVPKEPDTTAQNGPATLSSAAPGSTTAELAKDVPFESKSGAPGSFPLTPAGDETVSVNPLPASGTIGNPITLAPGETIPESAKVTNNLNSAVTTDQESYERDASDPAMAALAAQQNNPTIQSAAPQSTTAALAGAVPLENAKNSDSQTPAKDVPQVVKESISKAHVGPEAASSQEAVEEKKEVEQELLSEVPTESNGGEPAPTVTAATSAVAPVAAESRDLSPKSRDPHAAPVAGAETSAQPATDPTTESAANTAPEQKPSEPAETNNAQNKDTSPAQDAAKDKKKKNRLSGFISKLKEKMK